MFNDLVTALCQQELTSTVSEEVVTPLKNGVQGSLSFLKYWIPAFAGMTEMAFFQLVT
jgi:hypothetical protein